MTKLPIDEFLDLNNGSSIRRDEIVENMELLNDLFADDREGWIKACLTRLPHNQQETLFITFTLGAQLGKEIARQALVIN